MPNVTATSPKTEGCIAGTLDAQGSVPPNGLYIGLSGKGAFAPRCKVSCSSCLGFSNVSRKLKLQYRLGLEVAMHRREKHRRIPGRAHKRGTATAFQIPSLQVCPSLGVQEEHHSSCKRQHKAESSFKFGWCSLRISHVWGSRLRSKIR